MSQPKQPIEPDAGDASHAENPTGETPHGVPEGSHEHEPMGRPTSDRSKTETAVHRSGKP